MNKRLKYAGIFLLLCGLNGLGAQSSGHSAREIVARADDIFTINNRLYQKSTMTISRNGREQPIQIMDSFSMKEDGVTKSLTLFLEPRRVRGTAYLTIGDDLWVRFSSTGRVRKLSSSAKKNSAGGSDFSYSDMGEGNEGYGKKYNSSLDGSVDIEGTPCFRLILTPYRQSDDTYEKIIAFISEDEFRYLKLELYEDGAHIKTMSFDNYTVLEGRVYPYTIRMESHARNSISVVDTLEIELDSPKVESRFFTQSYLETIR